jgi:hypothetical protein
MVKAKVHKFGQEEGVETLVSPSYIEEITKDVMLVEECWYTVEAALESKNDYRNLLNLDTSGWILCRQITEPIEEEEIL